MGYFDGETGKTVCFPVLMNYTNDYWPQDYLTRYCINTGLQQMKNEFGGMFHDGRYGIAMKCKMPDWNGVVYLDPENPSVILRTSIEESLPIWNKQTWDHSAQIQMNFPDNYWHTPVWLNCSH